MKYVTATIEKDKDQNGEVIFVFPNLINHNDFWDMAQSACFEHFDNSAVLHAGFIRQLEGEDFRFACSGRSESLDLESSIHDCTILNGRRNEYSVCKITGVVDKYIAARQNEYPGCCIGDTVSFDLILPNAFDVNELWNENLRYVKLGDGRDWSRSFRDWTLEIIKV